MSQGLAALSQPKPGFEFSLLVLNGNEKGTIYRLTGSRITLGRGLENDIQFPLDIKCSRQHAVLEFTEQGIFIENISDANYLFVDHNQVRKIQVKHGSHILLGQTELMLNVASPQADSTSIAAVSPPTSDPSNAPPPFHSQTRSPKSMKRSSSHLRILIVLLVGLFLFLFLFNPSKKKNPIELRTDEAVNAAIEEAEQVKESAITDKQKQGKNSQQYDDAQNVYLQGFRDYKQGNYGRALELFQACLSLFPEHTLCQRNLTLAQRKYNELVQHHIILGRKYREQGQYSACQSSFRNVMVMVADTTSAIYKEAKANYEACETLSRDRY